MRVKENKPSRSKFLEGKIIPLKCYTQSKHIMTDEKCQGFKQGRAGRGGGEEPSMKTFSKMLPTAEMCTF